MMLVLLAPPERPRGPSPLSGEGGFGGPIDTEAVGILFGRTVDGADGISDKDVVATTGSAMANGRVL